MPQLLIEQPIKNSFSPKNYNIIIIDWAITISGNDHIGSVYFRSKRFDSPPSFGSKRSTHYQYISYQSAETYLDRRILLWSSRDQILPPGDHAFPFAFKIPANCPPNYKGKLHLSINDMSLISRGYTKTGKSTKKTITFSSPKWLFFV